MARRGAYFRSASTERGIGRWRAHRAGLASCAWTNGRRVLLTIRCMATTSTPRGRSRLRAQPARIGCVTVVGHTFGGQGAFRAAATAPNWSTVPCWSVRSVRASRSKISLRWPARADVEGDGGGRTHQPGRSPLPHDRIGVRARAGSANGRLAGPLLAPDAVVGRDRLLPDLADDRSAGRHPARHAAGAADHRRRRPVHSAKGARWLQQQLPDATLVEIPDCGHYPMLEEPDAFESALLKFVSA